MPLAPRQHRPFRIAKPEQGWASRRAPRRKAYNSEAWRRLRDYIRERDGWVCQICGEPTGRGDGSSHVDHIVPAVSEEDVICDEENLHLLCERCHNAKTGRAGH